MIGKIKKAVEQDDKALSLMILFLAVGEIILIFVDLQAAVTLLGTGLATLAGASAAFTYQKKENTKKEKQLLQLTLFYLAKIYERNPDHSEIMNNMISYEEFVFLPTESTSIEFKLDDISFMIEKNLQLYKSIYNFNKQVLDYEDKVNYYNKSLEQTIISNALNSKQKQTYTKMLHSFRNQKILFFEAYTCVSNLLAKYIRDNYPD
ncbi:hypothetical protein [Maridesulfovibrio sp.]|uniref:hypothetical protein n=1 Tax=Maridesulfovibrio sp. TaxID=2795000 RepID=UPI003BAC4AB4